MKKILLIGLSVMALSACSTPERHFWQKTDPNTAIYLTGVKAQQTLEQDISECVHTIIELSKLSDVRDETSSMPQSYDQPKATEEMSRLPLWDVPEYVRDLRIDHTDFHDFDGCMAYKGWTRVRYVGPEAEKRSLEIYDDTASYSVRPKNIARQANNEQMNDLHKER